MAAFETYAIPDLTDAERTPPQFVVDGIIPCGLSFLSGAPKLRKSFLALQLGTAVATGGDFLGHKTRKSDVLYLDLEGSKSRIFSRAERMSTVPPRNLLIANSVPRKLAGGLVDDLKAYHQQNPECELYIIDTYSRARGVVKTSGANAYDADIALLEPIQRMATDEKIAVLFIHHDRKGAALVGDSFERLSGTMAISGSSDCVLNLIADGKRFDGRAKLEYCPRDAPGGEMSLVFDDLRGEWHTTESQNGGISTIGRWILDNVPERGREGIFIPYENVTSQALRFWVGNSGDYVRNDVEPQREQLFKLGVGVQLGVASHGKRGIRIFNLR